jgi:hypothetical protein
VVPLEEPWGGWLRPGSERGYNILFGGVQHQMTFFRQENVSRRKYLKNNEDPRNFRSRYSSSLAFDSSSAAGMA